MTTETKSSSSSETKSSSSSSPSPPPSPPPSPLTSNEYLESLSKDELVNRLQKSTVQLLAAEDDRSRLLSSINDTSFLTERIALLARHKPNGETTTDDNNLVARRTTPTTNTIERDQTRKTRYQHVRVGVGVLIQDPLHPTRVFAGTRRGSHGSGTLALPGGHLEKFETWEECAVREVLEETGLRVEGVRFGHVTNDRMVEEDRHYVTIFVMCRCVDCGEMQVPQNLEPEKCDGWESYSWEDLRGRLEDSSGGAVLFGPLKGLVEESPTNVVQFLQDSN